MATIIVLADGTRNVDSIGSGISNRWTYAQEAFDLWRILNAKAEPNDDDNDNDYLTDDEIAHRLRCAPLA